MLENSKRNPKILGSSSVFILFYLNQDVEFHGSSIFVMEFWVNPPWVKKKTKKKTYSSAQRTFGTFSQMELCCSPHKCVLLTNEGKENRFSVRKANFLYF